MKPIFPGSASGFANVAFKPICGSITPNAIRPDDPHLPRRVREFDFLARAQRSTFFESSRDNHRAFDLRSRTIADDSRNGRSRRRDDGKIDGIRHILELSERFSVQARVA